MAAKNEEYNFMDENLASLISKPKIFGDLEKEELESIAKLMEIREYNEKADIFEEDSIGSEFFVIISGSVWVRKKDSHGKDHQLSIICCSECFGKMTLIDEMPRSASVRALEKTRVAVLKRSSYLKMKKDNIEVYCHILENIAKEFSSRLRNMDVKYVKLMNLIF